MIDVPTRVKDALRENNLLKNYRFNVLNDDDTVDFTIDNNNLKSEKVCFDERLASGDVLKFGLCEGTSLEFQYFGLPDINGRRIQAFIDAQYKDAEGQKQWYTIPMGFYTVKKCPMQFSTGIRKVTAYNKLMSDYLDAKANKLLIESTGGDSSKILSLYDIQAKLLSEYAITERNEISYPVPDNAQDTASTLHGEFLTQIEWNNATTYGYNTPLSAYEFKRHTGTEPSIGTMGKVWIFYHEVTISINTEYWCLDFIKGSLDEFVNRFYEGVMQPLRAMYHGYEPNLTNTKYFSIITKIFNEQSRSYVDAPEYSCKFLNPNISPSDFLETLNSNPHKGKARITFRIPRRMGFLDEYNKSHVTFYDRVGYSYWTDIDHSNWVSKTYNPNIYFSDGDAYREDTKFSEMFQIREKIISDAEKIEFTIGDMPDFTLREIIGADYELSCQFGKLDRQTDLFSGVELSNPTLYPQDTLYPEDTLYPSGTKERTIKSSYSQLWTDDGGVQSFKYLIITYQGLDENNQKVDYTLQRTINTHGTTNYNLSDNWLFKNLVWTSEQIGAYADAMVEKMRNIRWFPFEMWASGLPYLETGDEIEIVDRQGQTHTSYVLKRTLEGIQNLQDTYENGIVDVF